MRERVTSALEVVGPVSITVGVGLWFGLAAALITAGVLMLAVAWLVAE